MRVIAVIGAPGSGKTTVGALLAERLGLGFVDVDSWIEQRDGRLVREIFADDGEPAFRALESEASVALLASGGVVSLGGGAPMTPAVAEALADVETVWLMVDARHASARIGLDGARSLAAGAGLRATLIRQLNARTPVYRRLARHAVDTNGRRPDEVVDEIVSLLEEAR